MFCPSNITGVGLGLRNQHFATILEQKPDVPFFEVLADDYFDGGGMPLQKLLKIREDYPITLHAVSLSIGSAQLNLRTVDQLNRLIDLVEPAWVSDHLCWTHHPPYHHHELLPIPYTEALLQRLGDNIAKAQEQLKRPLIIENVSSYLTYADSIYSEAEFLVELCRRTGCRLLLDINNIAVSAFNHQYDPLEYLLAIPPQLVQEMHLAGYSIEHLSDGGSETCFRLDTHGEAVHEDVWILYQKALTHFGKIPTIVEWDNNIPSFSTLHQEALMAANYQASTLQEAHEIKETDYSERETE